MTRRTIATRVRRAAWGAAWLVLAPASFAAGTGPAQGDWAFRALLDGKPIGTHRFTLRTDGDQRMLHSVASFDVKLLGFTAYRYRHDDTERWQGDCLAAVDAKTDDDGKALTVTASADGNALRIEATEGNSTEAGCVMSFAYWHPAMLKQHRLLNVQTGKVERVTIEPLGTASIQVQGKTVEASHYRITGPKEPVELWYAPDGDWLALESTVSGGKRKLRYERE